MVSPRGSIQTMPGSSGGAVPSSRAPAQPRDDPGNRDRMISGKRRTIARFAALSTMSQHDAARNRGDRIASTSVTFLLVDLDAAPRSIKRFQISANSTTRCWSSRMQMSTTPADGADLVGSSNNPGRPISRDRRRRSSWAAR